MLLVLLIHYVPSRITPTPQTLMTNFWDVCLNLELRSLCFVCVNCFILISGYFGIRWKWKSITGFLFQILFYSLVAWLIGYVAVRLGYGEYVNLSGNHLDKAFTARWFIGAYLLLYLLAPILNDFIDKCSQVRLGRFIIVFYIVSTVYGYLMLSRDFNQGMSVLSLIGLYLCGAYCRRFRLPILTFKPIWDLCIYLGLGFVLVAGSLVALKAGITKSLYGYLNPLIILQSIYLFLFFSKLNIKESRIINIAAASAFSVYLLHHHQYVFGLYQHIGEKINEYTSISLLLACGFFACIYLFCIIIDPIRRGIFSLLVRWWK